MQHLKEKLKGVITALAGEYLSREADSSSLITVTGCKVPDNMRSATILISVLPENRAGAALAFAQHKLPKFRAYVASHARLKYVPFFHFAIDRGEQNRQALDNITRSKNFESRNKDDIISNNQHDTETDF
jgi:ribosome-binding factor A